MGGNKLYRSVKPQRLEGETHDFNGFRISLTALESVYCTFVCVIKFP